MLTIPLIASSFGGSKDGRDHAANENVAKQGREFDGGCRGTKLTPGIS
jgi:hypothetical protein